MIYYEDLLQVPYKAGGRSLDGLDCFGLILECCKRANEPIPDIANGQTRLRATDAENYFGSLGLVETGRPVKNGIIQCEDAKGDLHCAFLLDKQTALHCSYNGVKRVPVFMLHNKRYFKVKK